MLFLIDTLFKALHLQAEKVKGDRSAKKLFVNEFKDIAILNHW
jgi:hypothetical protein